MHRTLIQSSLVALLLTLSSCVIVPRARCPIGRFECGDRCVSSDARCPLGIRAREELADGSRVVRVTGVLKGSPAATAGLRTGDRIRRINGSRASLKELRWWTKSVQTTHDPLKLVVRRGASNLEFRVPLKRAPAPRSGGGYGKRCTKGIPCGATCIAATKRCHK